MKTSKILHSALVLLTCLFGMLATGCSNNDMDDPTLDMNGDDMILSFSIDGHEGTIDQVNKTVEVFLPQGSDVTSLKPQFTLSEGAQSDIAQGSTVDFTRPVVFKITNGNTYIDYTVTVSLYKAQITSLTLKDMSGTTYNGVIDDEAKTVKVYMPVNTDVTRLTLGYTLSAHAGADQVDGTVLDLSSPVQINVTNNGATATYTVSAIATDMPVTVFIGTATTVSGLKDEEKAAAEWMLNNIPRARYVSMQALASGEETLDADEVKAVWWHGDRDDWPSQAWESREAIKEYYARGGSLLLSRYAARYINDVYQIAIDQKEPNAQTKEDPAITLTAPLGFNVDQAEHAIFQGFDAVKDQTIYLLNQGCLTTNCRVDWNIWDYPDHSLQGWETATGGRRLAYETDDSNKTAIVEFPARSSRAGRVICVGAGAFEWSKAPDSGNQYSANRNKLTENMLRYLAGL